MLHNHPHFEEINFAYISDQGLRYVAASASAPNLRAIVATVGSKSLAAIQTLCKACPNLRDLSLRSSAIGIFGDELRGDKIIKAVAQYCPLIESMSTETWKVTDVGLDILATIPTLREIKVASFECTSTAIQRVIESHPNLTCVGVDTTVVDDALVSCIGRCCRNLIKVNLSCFSVSEYVLQDLFRGLPQLEIVHLSKMSNVTLRELFANCYHLVELHLYRIGLALDVEPILHTPYPSLTKLEVIFKGAATSALLDILTCCTNLHVVTLEDCNQVTNEALTVLTRNCRNLDTLIIRSCTNVTFIGMLEVATHCTRLTTLELADIPFDDRVLIQMSLNCRSLSSLSLFSCKDGPVTEAGMLALVERCAGLTRLAVIGWMAEHLTATFNLWHREKVYPHIKLYISPS